MKKTLNCMPLLLMVSLLLSNLLLFGLKASAQEGSMDTDLSVSADATASTKVDAGNALNAHSNARATDPADSDGDGYGDSRIREGGQTVDAGTVPESQSQQGSGTGDVDEDGYGDTALVEPDYLDDDSDDDGIDDEVSSKEIEVIEYRNGDSVALKIKDVDKATPKLMDALSMDATTPLLQPGIRVGVTADSCGSEKTSDCDDGDTEEISPSASFDISVSGVTVRGWNLEQKKALQDRSLEMTAVETPNDFGIWLVAKVLGDNSIAEVDVSREEVVVKYETKARLLGIIPITVPTTARLGGRVKTGDVTLEREMVSDEVEIDYPWYGFLLQKKSVSDQIVSNTVDIVTNYNASQKKEAKFKAGKALADTVK